MIVREMRELSYEAKAAAARGDTLAASVASNELWHAVTHAEIGHELSRKEFSYLFHGVMVTPEILYDIARPILRPSSYTIKAVVE